MNKKLSAALSGGAVLVLALTGLTGCSSEDNSDDKANDWAKKVCDQVQPQLKNIESANTSIQEATADNSTPEDVQKTDSAAFQKISDAYAALGKAVNNAGAPPVENGAKTQKEAVAELNGTSKAYAELRAKVDELDTKDQAKFADGLKGVADDLEKLSQSGDDALKKLQSGDVGQAMAKQTGCQRPSGAGPASASPGA
ncbi:small secreted protein [Streptomyces sp. GC420]|uniref:small secreted protein n=1 Tax=Streptomyces sp. GC420 TaxID=2697568 RepID=UPI001414E11B|nr:small secreted protein [Streptomyces sp. GC420]NBM19686.1 small secreted protein [Streptomyces sp. GC420]